MENLGQPKGLSLRGFFLVSSCSAFSFRFSFVRQLLLLGF